VTGATGSVGPALVERLCASRRLCLLVRGRDGASGRERLEGLLPGAGLKALQAGAIDVVEGDAALPGLGLDAEARARLARSLEAVLHAAARTDFLGERLDEYRPINVGGALSALELAAEARCPLIHVSTAYVSGDHDGCFLEGDLDKGQGHHNPYERSKREAEAALTRAARELRVPLWIFRPGIVLGDAPRPGAPPGPGPLVYLKYLAGLEGREASAERVLRCAGDPRAQLNLVPLDFVVRVLAEALARPIEGQRTFHLTAGRPTAIAEIEAAANEHLAGIRARLVPAADLSGADRYERILARRCRPYQPYLFLHTVHDRRRLVSEFDGEDGANPAWLRQVFAAHLSAWREEAPPQGAVNGQAARAREYFEHFLAARTGVLLVAGLKSLSADFTVSVAQAGCFRLRIVDGVLESVAQAPAHGACFDFAVDAESFLAAVSGRVKPAELFFEQKVRIRGDLHDALATAAALEDFFALHPFACGARHGDT
ncbi:MAG: SDR family oxidoreductase, partial [Planctomycetes bacterium]|nr:SDR family oxidoreductase [Planctomycetota bacterium]